MYNFRRHKVISSDRKQISGWDYKEVQRNF